MYGYGRPRQRRGELTGRADSTNILDMRMYVLLKYLIAAEACSTVLNPTKPIRRWLLILTSVTSRLLAEKCFRNSASVMLGGMPLTKIREEAIVSCHECHGTIVTDTVISSLQICC